MKKSKLELYETTITVYEYKKEEDIEVLGLPEIRTALAQVMSEGQYTFEGERKAGSFFGEGYNEDTIFNVLAEGIDEKQLSNIFISLGAKVGYVSYTDISGVDVISPELRKAIAMAKINPDAISTGYLGINTQIVAGTIKTEDLQKPAAKAKAKKKSTRK